MIEELKPEQIMDVMDCVEQNAIEAKLTAVNSVDKIYLAQKIKQVMIANHYKIFVYYLGSKIVGYVSGKLQKQFWNDKTYGHIEFIYLHQGYKNRNIEKELFERFESWAVENGADYIISNVSHFDNQGNMLSDFVQTQEAMYQNIGFKKTGSNYVKLSN